MEEKTFTLTFCESGENHKGMQTIGEIAGSGFSIRDIRKAKEWFKNKEIKCDIYRLHNLLDENIEVRKAYLFVAKNGVSVLSSRASDELFEEQDNLKKDKHAKMYGRVVSKKARHNLCFADISQEPDYGNGNGTIVNFSDVPFMAQIRQNLPEAFGEKAKDLICEGNYYYDVKKCYIGFHGDTERKRVIGVRLGADFPLHYQWYQNSKAIGDPLEIILEHGDVYCMSSKAVGWDYAEQCPHSSPRGRNSLKIKKYLYINISGANQGLSQYFPFLCSSNNVTISSPFIPNICSAAETISFWYCLSSFLF
jgi:alkylated DNA repair dioxygenase AlkB